MLDTALGHSPKEKPFQERNTGDRKTEEAKGLTEREKDMAGGCQPEPAPVLVQAVEDRSPQRLGWWQDSPRDPRADLVRGLGSSTYQGQYGAQRP